MDAEATRLVGHLEPKYDANTYFVRQITVALPSYSVSHPFRHALIGIPEQADG